MSNTSEKEIKQLSDNAITVDILKKMHRQNQMIISLLKEIKSELQSEKKLTTKSAPLKGKNKKQYIHVIDTALASKKVDEVKERQSGATPVKPTNTPVKKKKISSKASSQHLPKKNIPAKKSKKKLVPTVVLSQKSLEENSLGEENPFLFSKSLLPAEKK